MFKNKITLFAGRKNATLTEAFQSRTFLNLCDMEYAW